MAIKKDTGLTKEQIKNIKNYGNEITTLASFVESVRKVPGMYIGSIGDRGFINMIREIFQNGLDEINKNDSPATWVKLSYDERSYTVIVEDDGRGIPFDNIIRIFRDQHTSSNFNKKLGEYSSGLHGIGAKVTNALSRKFIIESFIFGEGRKVEFDEGFPWDKGEVKIPNKDNKQGTRITFQPSIETLGELQVTWEDVYRLVSMILPLSKLGAVVEFTAIDANGKTHKEKLVNKDGILSYLIDMVNKPLVKPIRLFKDTGEMKVELAFTYDIQPENSDSIIGFCNFCPTIGGTHIDGFMEGIGQYMANYMNKIYLASGNSKAKKAKLTITTADAKYGLGAAIVGALLKPHFDGQAKDRLSTAEMKPFVKGVVMEGMEEYQKTNPGDFQKICKYIKEIAELRLKQDKEKIKIQNQYSSNVLTGLPSKYVAPKRVKGGELFIAEGDSAASTMRNNRDNEKQGYFPIKGKIPNAFSTARAKFLANEEIAGILSIIFYKYPGFDINKIGKKGYTIDPDKVLWDKIVFATDADPDGGHIDALLLRFFLLYLPELIIAGKVYSACAPLYGIRKGSSMVYFNNKYNFIEYMQKDFSEKYQVSYTTGKAITPKDLSKILYDNEDYKYEIDRVANGYSIDPDILETILIDYKPGMTAKQIEKVLKVRFRFVEVSLENKVPILKITYKDKTHMLILKETIFNNCGEIYKILKKNKNTEFIINGEVHGLYALMALFEKVQPSGLERYKGLGEMNGAKLQESTLDVSKRTIIRYTIEDVKKAVDDVRHYENDMAALINSVEVKRSDIL